MTIRDASSGFVLPDPHGTEAHLGELGVGVSIPGSVALDLADPGNRSAAQLHLGYGTVKTHVSHLLTKLGCRDRAQLVMYAYESGHAVPRGA